MTPYVGKLFTRASINHVVDVLFLTAGPNVFTVKMIDMIEFQALGAVSGHEADGTAGGFEDMFSVSNRLSKGPAVSNEYPHTFSGVCNAF